KTDEGTKTNAATKTNDAKKPAVVDVSPPPSVGVEPLPPPITVEPVKSSAKVDVEIPKVGPMGDGANVGRLTLTERKSVLFKRDGQSGRWSRLAVPASLSAGEVFLSPPACRNTLLLRGDLQVQTVGDARVELDHATAGPP